MSPRGRTADASSGSRRSRAGAGAIILCGRFEGVDERLIEGAQLEEISLGDYVLSGGEIAALALLDACVRLLPGVMGKEASAAEESFAQGLLEYPQYTRPAVWEGQPIPEVLISGDHAKVAAWRRAGGRAADPRAPAGPVGRASGPSEKPEARSKRVTNAGLWRRSLANLQT